MWAARMTAPWRARNGEENCDNKRTVNCFCIIFPSFKTWGEYNFHEYNYTLEYSIFIQIEIAICHLFSFERDGGALEWRIWSFVEQTRVFTSPYRTDWLAIFKMWAIELAHAAPHMWERKDDVNERQCDWPWQWNVSKKSQCRAFCYLLFSTDERLSIAVDGHTCPLHICCVMFMDIGGFNSHQPYAKSFQS